ncbi:hypothetical protein MPH_03026, partial [Macrophomina phaseolina MS6]
MRFGLATAALLAASAHAAPRPNGGSNRSSSRVGAVERRAALETRNEVSTPLAGDLNQKTKRWFTLAP